MRAGVLIGLIAWGACGSGSNSVSPDMGPGGDAGSDMAGCHPTFGRSFVVDSYGLEDFGKGIDLTGDGTPDNVLGVLSSFANMYWNQSLQRGNVAILLDFVNLDGPPLVEGQMPTLGLYVGIDEDNPVDPSDNYTGMGRFLAPAEVFDVDCKTTANFDSARIEGGLVKFSTKKLTTVSQGIGTLTFSDAVGQLTIAPDFSRITSGALGGVGLVCTLSLTPPPVGTGTFLELIVNAYNLQPDIDRDGDGLEKVMGDGSGILECIDGDGTRIVGRNCTCDPRIQDGYSGSFYFTGIRAEIVGIVGQR